MEKKSKQNQRAVIKYYVLSLSSGEKYKSEQLNKKIIIPNSKQLINYCNGIHKQVIFTSIMYNVK